MIVKNLPGVFSNHLSAIILDMDGVLVDSEPVHTESFRIFLKHLNISYTEAFIDSLVGYSVDNNIEAINRVFLYERPMDIDEGIRQRNRIYLELINNLQLVPLEGIDALVTYCQENAIKVALASSSGKDQVDTILNNLSQNSKNKINYKELFAIKVCGDDVENRKPAPDIYQRTLKLLNIEARKCIAVEDSEAGIRSAKANEIYCIALKNQYQKNEKLADADYEVSSITKIVDLLKTYKLNKVDE